jgi:hypothetical protein
VTTGALSGRLGLFARLWGVAMVAHVVGNWSQPDLPKAVAWVNVAVGLWGLWLAVRPTRVNLLVGSALILVSLLHEIPVTGSHWMLAGLAGLAVLVTRATPGTTEPALRWVLLAFYVFAAFSKLNSGFVEPDVSCAVFYANQSLGEVGLGPVGGQASHAVIWASLATELSVPVLLAFRRTRYWGVVLALLFHGLISFDHGQHFYDFTAVLLPLFLLFLPEPAITSLTSLPAKLPAGVRRLVAGGLIVAGAISVVFAMRATDAFALHWLRNVPFVAWIPFYVAVVGTVLAARPRPEPSALRLSPAAAVVVALVAFNGLAPYLELKTAFSFNMYSNLQMVDGASNHLLVGGSLPLRHGYRDPVQIVATSDPGLRPYQAQGYLVAYPQLRRYLSQHRDISLTFRQAGRVRTVNPVSADPVLVDPGPWWWRYLPLRAVDTRDPPRCQTGFLPAL